MNASNTLLCCEKTAIYASNLISWSAYQLWIEKAIQIKRSIDMQRGKDDKVDAHRIAMYAFHHHDQAVIFERPRQEVEELKHLLTARQRLIKQKKQLEVPLKELEGRLERCIKRVENCSKNAFKGLKKDLEALEEGY